MIPNWRPMAAATLVLVAGLSTDPALGRQGAGPSPLMAAVRAADADDDGLEAVLRAALDATEDDRSRLAAVLRRGTSPQRAAALTALAYAGGDEAIATLQREGHPSTDTNRRALLGFALAGRGTGADRAVLTRELRGEHFGDDWPPIVAAALSLGVLRAAEATPALERVANTADGSGAAHAADEALRWIRNGPWRIELPASSSDDDRVIAAAFRNGIPRTADAPAFYEASRGGAWTLDGAVWRFHPRPRTAEEPTLDFTVHRNGSGTQALLSVAVSFGPKNAAGYDYVLVRQGDEWRVRGVRFTWIS
jgi:hypothetical protein